MLRDVDFIMADGYVAGKVPSDIEVTGYRHTCIGRYAKHPCKACEVKRACSEDPDCLAVTGGRYIEVVKAKGWIEKKGWYTSSVMLTTNGDWWEGENGDTRGIFIENHGSVIFVPEGRVLWEGEDSVHGAFKIRKHQRRIVFIGKRRD